MGVYKGISGEWWESDRYIFIPEWGVNITIPAEDTVNGQTFDQFVETIEEKVQSELASPPAALERLNLMTYWAGGAGIDEVMADLETTIWLDGWEIFFS